MTKNNVLLPILFVLTVLITVPALQGAYADNTFSGVESPLDCSVKAQALAISVTDKARTDVRETITVDLIGLIAVANACDQVIVADIIIEANGVPICTIPHHDGADSVRINAGAPEKLIGTCSFFSDVVPLNPEGEWQVSTNYSAQQLDGANSNAGGFVNDFSVGFDPSVTLTKTPDRAKASILESTEPAGATPLVPIEYSFVAAFNPGSNSLLVDDAINCEITDDTFASPIVSGLTLKRDGTPVETKKTFKIGQTTLNEATLSCPMQSGPDETAKSTAEVKIINPAVEITKSTDDKILVGAPITYDIVVRNLGDTKLFGCIVDDPLLGFNQNIGDIDPLPSANEVTFEIIDQDGVEKESTNTVTVTCKVQDGPDVKDDDSETVTPVTQDVTFDKTIDGNPVKVYRSIGGEDVTTAILYNYEICTTPGTASLVCSLYDDKVGDGVVVEGDSQSTPIQTGIVVPENGKCETVSHKYDITDADVLAMKVENNAAIKCKGQEGLPDLIKRDFETIPVLDWDFVVTDVCTPKDQTVSGPTARIDWTIKVTNTAEDKKSPLTVDIDGTFYTIDPDTNARILLDNAPDKDRSNVNLPYSDGTTPGIDYTVFRDNLPEGVYLDEVIVTAVDQQGNKLTRTANDQCKVEEKGQFGGCTPGGYGGNAQVKNDYQRWRNAADNQNWYTYDSPVSSFNGEVTNKAFYGAIFGVDKLKGDTMYQALKKNGGHENALERHCAAAFLNALNSNTALNGVTYFLTPDEVVIACSEAHNSGSTILGNVKYDVEGLKNLLAFNNELGCFENAHGVPQVVVANSGD